MSCQREKISLIPTENNALKLMKHDRFLRGANNSGVIVFASSSGSDVSQEDDTQTHQNRGVFGFGVGGALMCMW
jgi:hypothetical protein